ncbi:MAG: gfo/Idh/MocA family oxidoreductase, partial [Planctomyces sp.]
MTQADSNHTQRRSFLRSAAAFASATGVTFSGSKAARAMSSPNERIRVGCVGVNGRAGFLLGAFAERLDVEMIAVADIDSRNLPEAVERVQKLNGRTPRTEKDFRKLVDDPSIDVLVVGTPDHWHAIPTIMA